MIIKEGILFKQREHFRGWLPRYFTLDNNFLHYYYNKDDITPRKSLQINKEVKITTDVIAKVSNGITYYPFIISHPLTLQEYHLSTTSLNESILWVKAIQSVINNEINNLSNTNLNNLNNNNNQISPISSISIDSTIDKNNNLDKIKGNINSNTTTNTTNNNNNNNNLNELNQMIEENLDELNDFSALQHKLTIQNLSDNLITKIENAVEKILQFSVNCNETWIQMFEKDGVRASKRPGDGLICVRGETILPYSIPEIYQYISKLERRKELDPQIDTYTRVKWFSQHSGIEHILFKAIWPTAPRDFCNITHWRLLKNGTFITLGFGEKLDECPEQDGVVRGTLHIGGYVMQHVPGGTRIFIVVQSDVGGTLPKAITNMAAESQPMVLITMRKLLNNAYKNTLRTDISSSTIPPVKYLDILNIAKVNTSNQLLPEVQLQNIDDEDDDQSSSDHSFTSEETLLRDSVVNSVANRSLLNQNSPYLREGILYKQRDLVKGWRPRYFKLDSNFLHYYLHKSDVIPRKSLQITKDVKIIPDSVPRVVNGVTYYPFTISSNQSAIMYRLSSYNQIESNEWVNSLKSLINDEISQENISSSFNKNKHSNKNITTSPISKLSISSNSSYQHNESISSSIKNNHTQSNNNNNNNNNNNFEEVENIEDDSNDDSNTYHLKACLANLAPTISTKVNNAVERILELAFGPNEEWTQLFEKKNVIGSRKLGSGLICVKGETILPYTIPEIYNIVSRPERRKQLDTMLDVYASIKTFSYHTGVEYLVSKGVWPTAPRDFCNIWHWRLLKNGTFITLGFSENIEECPEKEGIVRGNLLIGGYVMQHVPGGTRIFIVVQMDLGGTLPTAITNLAAQSQPLVLITLRNILDTEYQNKPRPDLSTSKPPTYQEMLEVEKQVTGNIFDKKQKKKNSQIEQIKSLDNQNTSKKINNNNSITSSIPSTSKVNYSKDSNLIIPLFFIFFFNIIGFSYLKWNFMSRLLSTFIIILLFTLFDWEQNVNSTLPNGKQIYQLNISVEELIRSIHSLKKIDNEIKLSEFLLSKITQILPLIPSLNGCLLNNQFFPNKKSHSIHLSFIKPDQDSKITNLQLTNLSTKSFTQIFTEVHQILQHSNNNNYNSSTSNSKQKSFFNTLKSYFLYSLYLFQRKFNFSLPFISDQFLHQSSFGSVMIVPFQSNLLNMDEFSMYLPSSKDSIFTITAPITISFPETSLTSSNRSLKVPVTIIIEGKNISLENGTEFIHRFKTILQNH